MVGGLGCGRAKLNVLQIVMSVLCVGFAALLILRRVGCSFAFVGMMNVSWMLVWVTHNDPVFAMAGY